MSVDAGPPATEATCSSCGTVVAESPVTWAYEVDRRRGGRWICDRCARPYLRSIEAKLDQEWW